MPAELVTYTDLAARLVYPGGEPIPVNTFYTWNRRGQMPTPDHTQGRRLWWRWSTITRWARKEGLETSP